MRAINPKFVGSDPAHIAAIRTYMDQRAAAAFDDIRRDVAVLSALTDGELNQLVNEAGFETSNR